MIKTTGDLKNIIKDAFKLKNCTISETNQAIKRGFQAIRIATNCEILNIKKFLEDCPNNVLDK